MARTPTKKEKKAVKGLKGKQRKQVLEAIRENAGDNQRLLRRMGPSQVRHGDLYTLRIYLQEAADPQVYNDVKHIFWQVKGTVLTVLQLFPKDQTHRYLYWPREQILWYQTTPLRFEKLWAAQLKQKAKQKKRDKKKARR